MNKTKRNILITAVFIAGVVIINSLLNYLLVPYVAFSRQVIHDAAKEENVFDLVSLGSSEEFYCFNPEIADDILGVNSFNMGSSGTMLCGGEYATFEYIMKHQSPKRLILMIGRNTLCEDEEGVNAYQATCLYMHEPLIEAKYYLRMAFNGGELGRLFPWSSNHVDDLNGLIENIKVKSGKAFRTYDPSFLPDESLVYMGKGFAHQIKGEENCVSYADADWESCMDPETGEFIQEDIDFNPKQVKALKSMIDICHDKGCEIIITVAPITRYEMVSKKYYGNYMEKLKALCEENGAGFVDLNYARPELYDPKPFEYVDHFHVLDSGADRYTTSLCQWLKLYDEGTDTSDLFYGSWDEFVESVDWDYYMKLSEACR